MVIGALSFEPMSGSADRPYNRRQDAKYKNQQGAVEVGLAKINFSLTTIINFIKRVTI